MLKPFYFLKMNDITFFDINDIIYLADIFIHKGWQSLALAITLHI